jgi:hypothetical protein
VSAVLIACGGGVLKSASWVRLRGGDAIELWRSLAESGELGSEVTGDSDWALGGFRGELNWVVVLLW